LVMQAHFENKLALAPMVNTLTFVLIMELGNLLIFWKQYLFLVQDVLKLLGCL
ncbi:hypothetical protein ACJX0J_010133, partial [Zea mays]